MTFGRDKPSGYGKNNETEILTELLKPKLVQSGPMCTEEDSELPFLTDLLLFK